MRELRASKKIAGVGDQLSPAAPGPSTVVVMTDEPSFGAAATQPIAAPRLRAGLCRGQGAGWALIVTPELFTEAQRLQSSQCVVSCACCGRAGRVTRVVIKPEPPWTAQWRVAVRRRHERMRP